MPEIHPRTIDVRGKKWTLATIPLKGLWGNCDHPTMKRKQITIDPRQTGLTVLDTLLHEYLHAAQPDLSELAVEEIATGAAKMLWDLGYRGEWDE
jgi:hypothetical protein